MGQFMGWQSYDLPHRCGICGELGEEEDIEQCCQGNEQEFLKQSEETIKEMGQDEDES